MRSVERGMNSTVRTDPKVTEALSKPKKDEPLQPFTILLMGVDNAGVDGDSRSDTMVVARVDPVTRRVGMLSIPRDTKVHIPEHGTRKVNAAYQLGGPALTIDTLEEFLGVPINHYMEIDISGFKHVVEALGGVWIDVDVEIDDPKAAAGNVGRRGQHINPGYQLLDGDHALVYVRSRDFPDADFTRMKHQQMFFKALAKQTMRMGNVLKLPAVLRQFSYYTKTDLKAPELLRFARALRGMSDTDIQTATVPGEWHSPFIVPDESAKQRLVTALMSGGALEQTETAGAATSGIRAGDISVTVRNGAGRSGVARSAADRLVLAGYDVGDVGNADQFVYDRTLVVYKDGGQAMATAVLASLGRGDPVASRGMYGFETDILVVVGKDWPTAAPPPGGESAPQ
jgi:LCP family protein required for cell wall assembly